jgi:hypothetical protein
MLRTWSHSMKSEMIPEIAFSVCLMYLDSSLERRQKWQPPIHNLCYGPKRDWKLAECKPETLLLERTAWSLRFGNNRTSHTKGVLEVRTVVTLFACINRTQSHPCVLSRQRQIAGFDRRRRKRRFSGSSYRRRHLLHLEQST